MRRGLTFIFTLLLAILVVYAKGSVQEPLYEDVYAAEEVEGTDRQVVLEDVSAVQDVVDVCAPLDEARDILATMQPKSHAHLSKKLGGVSPSTGLGDGLGWGHDGPLSTAFRLLPRFISSLNPITLLSKIPKPDPRKRVSKSTRERAERLLALLDEADAAGCNDALAIRADIRMFPPKGVRQDLPEAFRSYKQFLESSSEPHSQFILGFFYATGLGGVERDQAKATLYYTFAALQGYKPAQMAMGYRYWAGIGVKGDCLNALDYYESAARNAYDAFNAGPPGGQSLLLSRSRLSDRYGGVFGPYASWASTGANSLRLSIKALKAAATGESEAEVLEFYQYHSDRDQHYATVRLGKFFYLGSVHANRAGISSGAEAVSEIPQSYEKARRYFYYVARKLWPTDYDSNRKPAPKKRLTKEAEDAIREHAMVAASFLGRMYMRGEGVARNYGLAYLWYDRAAQLGDAEAYNGLGILFRDGLGVAQNREKAIKYFETAARLELAEAQVNLAKMHITTGDVASAIPFLEAAQRNGSPFEAFYLLAGLHANAARSGTEDPGSGVCGVSVSYYKLVSELGAWDDDYLGEADRAWGRGEEEKALLGWWIAAEMGYEAGHNNVAFLLSRGVHFKEPVPEDTSLSLWTRSAAQGNADAMVMVGDYYYRGEVPASENNGTEGPDYTRAFAYYQTAADKLSSMAYWNLGYMYENGQGVPQDWHMAKRNYDLSVDASTDAYLPWLLSLTKLYLRSWWIDLRTRGATPGLALFEDDGDSPTFWESVKGLFVGPALDGVEDDGEYEDYSGAGWGPGDGNDQAGDNDFDDDLMESLLILALTGAIMGLVWLRGRWARQAGQQQ